MKLKYIVVSDYAAVLADGKPTITGIFDVIHPLFEPSREKPWIHPRIFVVFSIAGLGKGARGEAKLRIVSPSGEAIFDQPIPYSVGESLAEGINGVYGINGIRFPELGTYRAEIEIQNEVQAVEFQVRMR
ncbi:hypothetical protein EDM68_00295 [Candidatus Uhrbacteria bacterium]|nr:MAG: hypothetical protein EDM68_00295 [Candidatus Uhrbacteria bacterium]